MKAKIGRQKLLYIDNVGRFPDKYYYIAKQQLSCHTSNEYLYDVNNYYETTYYLFPDGSWREYCMKTGDDEKSVTGYYKTLEEAELVCTNNNVRYEVQITG